MVVVVMSGTYGSDPAVWGFFAIGWVFLAWGFGSGPVLQTALQYCILYSFPLATYCPYSFSPCICIIICVVLAYEDCRIHRQININMKFSYCFYVTKGTK